MHLGAVCAQGYNGHDMSQGHIIARLGPIRWCELARQRLGDRGQRGIRLMENVANAHGGITK